MQERSGGMLQEEEASLMETAGPSGGGAIPAQVGVTRVGYLLSWERGGVSTGTLRML